MGLGEGRGILSLYSTLAGDERLFNGRPNTQGKHRPCRLQQDVVTVEFIPLMKPVPMPMTKRHLGLECRQRRSPGRHGARVVERQHDDARAELDPFGPARRIESTSSAATTRTRIVREMMFSEPGDVEAHLIGGSPPYFARIAHHAPGTVGMIAKRHQVENTKLHCICSFVDPSATAVDVGEQSCPAF